MIDLEELDGGFRAVDAAKNEVTVEIDDWEPGGEELEIGYEVDETITGSGTAIRLPNGGFAIESSELDDPRMINMSEQVRLENGSHFFPTRGGHQRVRPDSGFRVHYCRELWRLHPGWISQSNDLHDWIF